jgi:hypothetical protein
LAGRKRKKTKMTINYKITTEPSFVRVVFTASVYSSPSQEVFTRVTDAARNAGVSKILYDVRSATVQLSTVDRFDHASRIPELFRGFKVAFVVNKSLRDPNLFGQTVAVNRGGNIRVVETLAEAYEWLGVESPNKPAGGNGK